MLPLQCPFCDHANLDGVGARYCNACGSRLQLKLCPQCLAANDQTVRSCYQCGAEFPAPSTTPEDAARAACVRLQQLLRSAPPVSRNIGAAATAATVSDEAVEHMHAPISDAVVESYTESRRQPGSPKAVAILSTLLLFAVVGSAYYVYRHLQLTELLSAREPNPSSPADLVPPGTHPRLIPERNVVTTTSDPPTSIGVPGVVGPDALGLSPKSRSSTVVTTSPPSRGSPRDDVVKDQTSMPDPSRVVTMPQVPAPTGDKSTPSPPSTAQAKGAGVSPAHPPPAAKSLREPTRATANPAARSAPGAGRPISAETASGPPALRNNRATVPPASPRLSVCTEAIAAAGLCNLNEKGGSQ